MHQRHRPYCISHTAHFRFIQHSLWSHTAQFVVSCCINSDRPQLRAARERNLEGTASRWGIVAFGSLWLFFTWPRAGAFDAPTHYDHKVVKAQFPLCCTRNTALEVWSRKPYSTRLRLVLYGFLDHTSRAVFPVQHGEPCFN